MTKDEALVADMIRALDETERLTGTRPTAVVLGAAYPDELVEVLEAAGLEVSRLSSSDAMVRDSG